MSVDYESELYVLAGMILSEALLQEGLGRLSEKHFQDGDYREIFNTIDLQSKQGRPDFTTVYKELRNKIDIAKLNGLQTTTISESTFPFWIKKLHETFVRRTYKIAAREIWNICDTDRPLKEITEIVEQKIMKAHTQEGTDRIVTPQESGQKAAEEFERRQASDKRIHGIQLSREIATGSVPSIDGFPGLDQMFRGLRGGDLIVAAARTGDGKTALAQNLVRHASIHQQYKTYYQNTEMNENEIVFRFVAAMSGISFEGIDGGGLSSWDRGSARRYFDLFCESRIYISTLPILTPERSRGLARQFKMKYGNLDLLVIDYIGRMELENSKGKQEWQVLRDIAKEGKRLAQELDTAVLLISQMTEEGKLQGARAIANECDGVLYLEPLEGEEYNEAPRGTTHKLTSAKARRGEKNKKLWISFNKDKMYMTEIIR
ncbi:replicative DNA helicase [Cohnella silvisoli]|uniref:DNA 5'-3' helicase n=1 Tax=Cohnella silvisoli TaxID=2873699 RepID=A0ABV1L330_9BACL|nr:DnaB-like helicase C-terminal domain-containing protein [Cohnella silvisoli]MCD9026025.1 AAA family ATPase [Cohnella silvisoli]